MFVETPRRKERRRSDGGDDEHHLRRVTVRQELTGTIPFKAHDSSQRQAPWSHRADDRAEAERHVPFTRGVRRRTPARNNHLVQQDAKGPGLTPDSATGGWVPLGKLLPSPCRGTYLLGSCRISMWKPRDGTWHRVGLEDEGCHSNNNGALSLNCTLSCLP